MWHIAEVDSPFTIWCSDGKPVINNFRGRGSRAAMGQEWSSSSRFIVDGKGFLDVTELDSAVEDGGIEDEGFVLINSHREDEKEEEEEDSSFPCAIDANGLTLCQPSQELLKNLSSLSSFALHLEIHSDGTFTLSSAASVNAKTKRGLLKPLPEISAADVSLIDHLISHNVIPYPEEKVHDKNEAEIRALGLRLFPFSPHSFQLAMVVYDWTTASFARMVLLNLYRYSALSSSSPTTKTITHDYHNLARSIWKSSWSSSYTPFNESFMRSFLLLPAKSQLDVELQLLSQSVERGRGQKPLIAIISDAENRLLSAALNSLPRTPTASSSSSSSSSARGGKRFLFSGQPDMSQISPSEFFSLTFTESPMNRGPANQRALRWDGDADSDWEVLRKTLLSFSSSSSSSEATAAKQSEGGEEDERWSYLSPGRTVTTKTTWSFTDTFQEAMSYSSGIILRAEFSSSSSSSSATPRVWETASYVTPLSNEEGKTEYCFPPGSRFEIRSFEEVDTAAVEGKGEGGGGGRGMGRSEARGGGKEKTKERKTLVVGIEPKFPELN